MSHQCTPGEEEYNIQSNGAYPFIDSPLVPAEEMDHTMTHDQSTFPSLDDQVSNQMFMIT